MGWDHLDRFLTSDAFAEDRQATGVAGLGLGGVRAVTDPAVCARLAGASPAVEHREASYFEGGGRYFVTHTLPGPGPEAFPLYFGLNALDVVGPDLEWIEGFVW